MAGTRLTTADLSAPARGPGALQEQRVPGWPPFVSRGKRPTQKPEEPNYYRVEAGSPLNSLDGPR
jgi:hypothetical protein